MSRLQARRRERAFERLYRRHVGGVYHYALAVLRDPQDAEEVTQTAFLNAYRSFRHGDRPRPTLNWLLSIAHEVCRRRSGRACLDDAMVADEDALPTANDVCRALARLPFDQRAALVMREVEGRTYTEIAEILALTVGAVEMLIFRARRSLREELEGALTCHEAELAVCRELDDRISRRERRLLRAHLRSCDDCVAFARGQRDQRDALRALAHGPLPDALQSFFGPSRGFPVRTAIEGVAVAEITLVMVALFSLG